MDMSNQEYEKQEALKLKVKEAVAKGQGSKEAMVAQKPFEKNTYGYILANGNRKSRRNVIAQLKRRQK